MANIIIEKLKESISIIIPVMIIMLLVGFGLGFNHITIISILFSTILLIFGITLFMIGVDLAMMEMGKIVASNLLKSKKVWLIILISFIVGIFITIAEPDLKVLATQMTAIDDLTLILLVGVGVGVFLALAAARIIYQINLKSIMAVCYIIIIIIMFLSKKEFVPLAFDSGGVTSGAISIPFVLAMGIGFSKSIATNKNSDDSFGLVALCSIGPIFIVLLLGMFINSNLKYTYNIFDEFTNIFDMLNNYIREVFPTYKEVLMSLLPIVLIFIIFSIITKNIGKRQMVKIIVGLIITLIGLTLFFVGVNIGYLPTAYLIGINVFKKARILLLPLGLIIGFVIAKAEPAVVILTEQIEEITEGSIKKTVIINTIAIGVAIAVYLSIFRVTTGISINGFLLVGYLIALLLMYFSPDIFTMVAFDSGGAVTGTMTTSFLLPFIIGISYASGANVLTDAFGLVAFVGLAPLLTIQLLGIIYKYKLNKVNKVDTIDETIIEFTWGG